MNCQAIYDTFIHDKFLLIWMFTPYTVFPVYRMFNRIWNVEVGGQIMMTFCACVYAHVGDTECHTHPLSFYGFPPFLLLNVRVAVTVDS